VPIVSRASLVIILVTLATMALVACDTETRPDSAAQAHDEAQQVLDGVGEAVFGDASFDASVWEARDGCDTAPFAPSQGDVGAVLIRSYLSVEELPSVLIAAFTAYWEDRDESVSQSSPNMDPGAVSRVHGIGYELVSLPPSMELRAFLPCY
jgi:hypothetical protein